MLVSEMGRHESSDILARVGFGRLACAHENQPYIVPIYFAYEPDHLYGFATMGQKIEWMRLNPLVCVEVDEIHSDVDWTSIVVKGRYEELPEDAKTGASLAGKEVHVVAKRICRGSDSRAVESRYPGFLLHSHRGDHRTPRLFRSY